MINLNWNDDMSQAPKGRWFVGSRKVGDKTVETKTYVAPLLWVSYDGDKTGTTRWLPETDRSPARWEGFTASTEPEAFIVLPGHFKGSVVKGEDA